MRKREEVLKREREETEYEYCFEDRRDIVDYALEHRQGIESRIGSLIDLLMDVKP